MARRRPLLVTQAEAESLGEIAVEVSELSEEVEALGTRVTALEAAVFPVTAAAYDWNSDKLHIALTHTLAVVNVSLPAEADVTLWVPGSAPRRCSKMNKEAFGFNFLTAGTCTINGGAADANMSPTPDSAVSGNNGVLAQSVLVYRETATAYWVWGGQ